MAAFLSDFQLSLGRSHSRLFFSSACFLYLFCDCLGVVFICIKALWLSDEKTRRSIFYICTCVYEEKIVVGFCVIVFRLSLSLSPTVCARIYAIYVYSRATVLVYYSFSSLSSRNRTRYIRTSTSVVSGVETRQKKRRVRWLFLVESAIKRAPEGRRGS